MLQREVVFQIAALQVVVALVLAMLQIQGQCLALQQGHFPLHPVLILAQVEQPLATHIPLQHFHWIQRVLPLVLVYLLLPHQASLEQTLAVPQVLTLRYHQIGPIGIRVLLAPHLFS